MTSTIAKSPIISEYQSVQFSSGAVVIDGKDGYDLANAYVINRGTSEQNTYAISSIYRRDNGTYRLQNVYSGLNARVSIQVVWVRK